MTDISDYLVEDLERVLQLETTDKREVQLKFEIERFEVWWDLI